MRVYMFRPEFGLKNITRHQGCVKNWLHDAPPLTGEAGRCELLIYMTRERTGVLDAVIRSCKLHAVCDTS